MNDHVYTPLSRSRRVRMKNKEVEEHQENEHSSLNTEDQLYSKETVHYAGFWVRVWAFLLDLIVVFSLHVVVIRSWFTFLPDGIQSIGPFSTLTFTFAAIFFVYFALMTKLYGKTVGKIVLGIKVVSTSEEGDTLSWKQIMFREGIVRLIYHLSLFQIPFLLLWLYFFVAFVPNKKGLHDLVSDTAVIHDKK